MLLVGLPVVTTGGLMLSCGGVSRAEERSPAFLELNSSQKLFALQRKLLRDQMATSFDDDDTLGQNVI